MKKGMTPELDAKWWAKNKPVFLGKTGLGAALKDYAIARDKFDHDGALSALANVRAKVKVATGKCKDKTQQTTRDVLDKYDGIIKKAENELKKQKDDAQKSSAAAPAPVQKMGKDVVIWKRDIGALVLKKFQPEWIEKLDGYTLVQSLNDDILDVFENEGDYVTPQQIVDDSEAIGQKVISDAVADLKKLDALFRGGGKAADVKKLTSVFDKRLGALMSKAKTSLEKLPEARWNKFRSQKKQYTKYKVKTGVKLTTGTIGIAAGVASIGLGAAGIAGAVPSMGGSLALAIPGLVAGLAGTMRSCAAMSKQIVDLSRSAEKVERVLESDLNSLKKRYDGACKAKVVAGETTASTVKGILGTDAPFLATIPKCNDNCKLLENKTAGIAVSVRKLSGQIMKALKQADAIEKSLKSLKDAKARKAYDKLVKVRAALNKALDKCSDMGGRMTKLEKALPNLKKMLAALNAKNPMFNKIFDEAFPIIVSGGLIFVGAGTGLADASSVAEFIATGAELATDVALEVTDFVTDNV